LDDTEYGDPQLGGNGPQVKGVLLELSEEQLDFLRAGIAVVGLSSHIECPPTNLGETSHGKLKANNWLVLFTLISTMVLIHLWVLSNLSRHYQLLQTLHHLVLCTHIVCTFSTFNNTAKVFDKHYILFCQGMKLLFPHAHSKPNHHFVMHYGWLLRFWGPIMALSEFLYERVHGLLHIRKSKMPGSNSCLQVLLEDTARDR
jgi:hypothetical protein